MDIILDFEREEDERVNALLELKEEEKVIDILNQLNHIYFISGMSVLRDFMLRIVNERLLSTILNFEVIRNLCEYDVEDSETCKILLNYCKDELNKEQTNLSLTYLLNTIMFTYDNEKVRPDIYDCIKQFIIHKNYSLDIKYKSLKSFRKNDLFHLFIDNITDDRYIILACQYLFVNEPDNHDKLVEKLLQIARDEGKEENVRADACDIIMNYQTCKEALDIIGRLGSQNKNGSIFENKQNVHFIEIDESLEQAIEFLMNDINMTEEDGKITIEHIEKELGQTSDDIRKAFIRIHNDNALYGKFHLTLANIVIRVWVFINRHDCVDELRKRLVEELTDASGTCSSGYATRLVNVLSGYSDFAIKISWRAQVYANFKARLNKLIQDLPDSENNDTDVCLFCEKEIGEESIPVSCTKCKKVVHEQCSKQNSATCDEDKQPHTFVYKYDKTRIVQQMTETSSDFHRRMDLMLFCKNNVANIVAELEKEFIPHHLTQTDFELYLRDAILMYET